MHYGWYANGFRFNSHLADLTFFFTFFQAYEYLYGLGLG